jgi:hypothetical protein
MKKTIEITVREPEENRSGFNRLPIEKIRRLVETFPEFGTTGPYGFRIKARELENSLRLKDLVRELWAIGKRPTLHNGGEGPLHGDTYCVTAYLKPDHTELDAAKYLRFGGGPENGIGEIYPSRLDNGKDVTCLDSEVRPQEHLGCLGHRFTGCSPEFRQKIEAESFVGLEFEEPPQHPNPDFRPKEPLFLLSSSIQLPPVLNESLIASYRPYILSFDSELFEAIGPFDVARTTEEYRSNRSEDSYRPDLIVSQRFRRFLLEHGIESDADEYYRDSAMRGDYHLIHLEGTGNPPLEPPLAAICRELGMPPATDPAT